MLFILNESWKSILILSKISGFFLFYRCFFTFFMKDLFFDNFSLQKIRKLLLSLISMNIIEITTMLLLLSSVNKFCT